MLPRRSPTQSDDAHWSSVLYDPEAGRFERRDPVELTLLAYPYVAACPLVRVDPSGLLASDVHNSCHGLNPGTPSRCGDSCQHCCDALALDWKSLIATAITAGLPGDVSIPSSTAQECQKQCEAKCNAHPSGSLCVRNFSECLFRTIRDSALLGLIEETIMARFLDGTL